VKYRRIPVARMRGKALPCGQCPRGLPWGHRGTWPCSSLQHPAGTSRRSLKGNTLMTDPTPQPAQSAPFTAAEDKQYATLATYLNIILLIPGLIFYFVFKDRGPMIAAQSKENLNWTINATGALIIAAILLIIPFLGGLLYAAVLIVNLVFSIIGGTKVNNGEFYKYPFGIRFIK
jgi:uncharacterized Tic20 family protein